MSIAAKCTCGRQPGFCTGGKGCRWTVTEALPYNTPATMNNQQLAEAIVNKISSHPKKIGAFVLKADLTAAILPLIAEFKKEVAGEAYTVGYRAGVLFDIPQADTTDRATYIDSLT